MELVIPLKNYSAFSDVTVTKSNSESLTTKRDSFLAASYSESWFVLHDGVQAIFCHIEEGNHYKIFGSLFFKLDKNCLTILSLLTCDGIVVDFSEGTRHLAPLLTSRKNIHVDTGGFIVDACFSPSDKVVLFSSDVSIGCVCLDENNEMSCTGSYQRFKELKKILCGVVVSDSLVVVLTGNGMFAVMNITDGVILSLAAHCNPSNDNIPVSCTLMESTVPDTIHIITTFLESGDAQVFTIQHKKLETRPIEEAQILEWNNEFPPARSLARSYTKVFKSYALVSSVWSDRMQFSVFEVSKLLTVSVIKNEMSVPYVSGSWVCGRGSEVSIAFFVVTRADGMALSFIVEFCGGEGESFRVLPYRHISLSSCCSTLLHGSFDSFTVLSVSDMESLWNGSHGAVSIIDCEGCMSSLHLLNKREKKAEVLLVDVTCFRETITVLVVKRSGESLAFLQTLSDVQTLTLALEQEPENVSSCLLYERQFVTFVDGHKDGKVHVWVDGQLECVNQMVHTGAVDKIMLLPTRSEQLECDFISVCTEQGTVALHHSKNYQCTRLLKTPCSPLTSLLWDEKTEYVFAISGSIGNLWHVPTCRLERTFYVPLSPTSQEICQKDLLSYSSTVCPIQIDKIVACGVSHFAMILDVPYLLKALNADTQNVVQSACRLALSVLLPESILTTSTTCSQLNLSRNILNNVKFQSYVVSSEYSAKHVLVAVLLAAVAKNSSMRPLPIDLKEVKTLCVALLSSLYVEDPFELEECTIQALAFMPQLPEHLRKVAHVLISTAIEQLQLSAFLSLIKKLSSMVAVESVLRLWFRVKTPLDSCDVWCYRFFIQTNVLAAAQKTKEVMNSAWEEARYAIPRLIQALTIAEGKKSIHSSLLLLALGDNYSYLRSVKILEYNKSLLDAIATLAFNDKRADAFSTLINIAIIEGKIFLENCVNAWYSSRCSWRPGLINFMGELIERAPVQSYNSIQTMIDFILRALDPHNPNKSERNSCMLCVTRMLRLTIKNLPNVAFQQNLQFLAVGNDKGEVQVINLKTTGIVASFSSHQESILCVAYSSDTSLHDIAVLGENMETVKIWRANRTFSVLSAILSGPMLEFKLRYSIDIPVFEKSKSDVSDLEKMIETCRLRWLSPHCVELTSPWHNKIQLALQ